MKPASRAGSNQPRVSAGRGDLHGLLRLLRLIVVTAADRARVLGDDVVRCGDPGSRRRDHRDHRGRHDLIDRRGRVCRRGRLRSLRRDMTADSVRRWLRAGRVVRRFRCARSRRTRRCRRRCRAEPTRRSGCAAAVMATRHRGRSARRYCGGAFRVGAGRSARGARSAAASTSLAATVRTAVCRAAAIERPRDTDCRRSLHRPDWTDVDHVRDEVGVDVRSCHCVGKKVNLFGLPALVAGPACCLEPCPVTIASGHTLVWIARRRTSCAR